MPHLVARILVLLSLLLLSTRPLEAQESTALIGAWQARAGAPEFRVHFRADGRFTQKLERGGNLVERAGTWSADGSTVKLVAERDQGEVEYTYVLLGDVLAIAGGDLQGSVSLVREMSPAAKDGPTRGRTPPAEAAGRDSGKPPLTPPSDYEQALDHAIAAQPSYDEEPALPKEFAAPDLTSADSAFRAFTEFWKRTAMERDYWRSSQLHALGELRAVCTQACLAKELRATRRKWIHADGTRFTWGDFVIEAREVGEDEAVFTTWNHGKLARQDLTTLAIEHTEHKEPFAFVFHRSGERWLLREVRGACPTCSGSAACRTCGGSGRAKSAACRACGGSGKCGRCSGRAMVSRPLDDSLLCAAGDWCVPADEWKPRTDRTSPGATALAYLDAWIAAEAYATRQIAAYLDQELATLFLFLEPQTVEAAKRALAAKLESGRKAAADARQTVESEKVLGETGFAKIASKLFGATKNVGLGMVRDGESWSVAKVLEAQCVLCVGKGECLACKGTGQMSGIGTCPNCDGAGRCKECGGFGMTVK